jgi:restriction endonuclease Mrr
MNTPIQQIYSHKKLKKIKQRVKCQLEVKGLQFVFPKMLLIKAFCEKVKKMIKNEMTLVGGQELSKFRSAYDFQVQDPASLRKRTFLFSF